MNFDKLIHLLITTSTQNISITLKIFLPPKLPSICSSKQPSSDISFQVEEISLAFLIKAMYLQNNFLTFCSSKMVFVFFFFNEEQTGGIQNSYIYFCCYCSSFYKPFQCLLSWFLMRGQYIVIVFLLLFNLYQPIFLGLSSNPSLSSRFSTI